MMYSAARRVDALGRIVLPAELRRSLGITEGDQLDIRELDGTIVMAKHNDACALCASEEDLVAFRDRYVCSSCIAQLRTKIRAER
jgi:transcriptional pleiotropic regulator of transition state genes